jgi:SAM-dependent methyltransferase
MSNPTTSRAFFDRLYLQEGDPWRFASSEYELGRYEVTIQALSSRRYSHAFEPGCSIGVLTARLATICEGVDAIDISSIAVRQASRRCSRLPNVKIRQGALPADVPAGSFDLIVLSEIGYYFDGAQLKTLVNHLTERMVSGSVFLAVHWLGFSPDHILSGSQVHNVISSTEKLTQDLSENHTEFLLDRWVCK